MRRRSIVAAIVLAAFLIPTAVLAQANSFDLRYDPASVTTISGTVLTTIDYNPGNPAAGPQSLLVQSDSQVYNVFLGPGSFVKQVGMTPTDGQRVTVTGSRRVINGRTYIVASTVSTPSQTFRFRSDAGVPLWSPPVVVSPPPVGRGPAGAILPFDPNTIVTRVGTIRAVKDMMTPESSVPITFVTLRGKDIVGPHHEVQVVLGPRTILDQSGIALGHKQKLTVTGSEVLMDGKRTLVATSVSQGPNMVNLRSVSGEPLYPLAVVGTQVTPQVVPAPPGP